MMVVFVSGASTAIRAGLPFLGASDTTNDYDLILNDSGGRLILFDEDLITQVSASIVASAAPSGRTIFEKTPTDGQTSRSTQTDRMVLAHYLVNNSQAYGDGGAIPTTAGLTREMQEAMDLGIDVWALNCQAWVNNDGEFFRNACDVIYNVADQVGFKLCMSIDQCCGTTASDGLEMVTRYTNRDSQFFYNGKQVVTSFASQNEARSWWDDILMENVFWVPNLRAEDQGEDPMLYDEMAEVNSRWNPDGGFYFGVAPIETMKASGYNFSQVFDFYMAPVLAYYWGSNQVDRRYFSYKHGLHDQWKHIISTQRPNWVEIVTWNDYEESYISPISAAEKFANWPAAGWAVNDDFHHTHVGAYEIMKYYIDWFKTGNEPAITEDKLIYSYRTHPAGVTSTNDPDNPVNVIRDAPVNDDIYITTFLTADATARITTGGAVTSIAAGPGVGTIEVPFNTGAQTFQLIRNGETIASANGRDIDAVPAWVNYFHYTGVVSANS